MFQIRTSKPSGNKCYITTSAGGWSTCIQGYPTSSGANVLSNCVGYACGRFNEIYNELTGNTGMAYKSLNCNAENFIERAKSIGLQISSSPVAGGIMVWQNGGLGSGDGVGHVEVVEQVYDSNNIYTSASNYGAEAFYNARRNNNNGRWGLSSAFVFRGCIINPAVSDTKNTGTPTPSSPSKSVDEVAREVLAGKWGNNPERKQKLESAGYNYSEVQNRVNQLLNEQTATPKKSNEEIAKEVLAGKWGNNPERKQRLESAGYDYNAVQSIVNSLVGSNSSTFNVGDRVEIIGGYSSSAYSGSAPNTKAKGSIRYIVKIYPNGKFPYQLGANPNDTSSNNTTGFASANSIRKV